MQMSSGILNYFKFLLIANLEVDVSHCIVYIWKIDRVGVISIPNCNIL